MKCPNCDTQLSMTDRQGIEIDFCPSCRGVWLDRGELDKIIERNMAANPAAAPPAAAPYGRERHWDDDRRHGYRKPHKNFLKELFD